MSQLIQPAKFYHHFVCSTFPWISKGQEHLLRNKVIIINTVNWTFFYFQWNVLLLLDSHSKWILSNLLLTLSEMLYLMLWQIMKSLDLLTANKQIHQNSEMFIICFHWNAGNRIISQQISIFDKHTFVILIFINLWTYRRHSMSIYFWIKNTFFVE